MSGTFRLHLEEAVVWILPALWGSGEGGGHKEVTPPQLSKPGAKKWEKGFRECVGWEA